MKVAILAGGFGSRLSEETVVRPKPMVEIGGKPILWHIMRYYAHFGFKEFVIALGYKGDYIKKWMADYCSLNGDLTVDLGKGRVRAPLRIALEGVPELTADGQPMEEVLLDAADDALDSLSAAHRRDDDTVAERLRRAVRFATREHWGKRPVVRVLVQRI